MRWKKRSRYIDRIYIYTYSYALAPYREVKSDK